MFFAIFLNLNLLVIVISLISILYTYLNLRAGNWQWAWPAWWMGFGVGLWTTVYCLWLGITEYNITGLASDIVYLGYTVVAGHMLGALCGMISLVTS